MEDRNLIMSMYISHSREFVHVNTLQFKTHPASTTADILNQIEDTNSDVCGYTLFHNKRQVTAHELNHTLYLSTVYILTEFNYNNSHLYLAYSLPTAFPR